MNSEQFFKAPAANAENINSPRNTFAEQKTEGGNARQSGGPGDRSADRL